MYSPKLNISIKGKSYFTNMKYDSVPQGWESKFNKVEEVKKPSTPKAKKAK